MANPRDSNALQAKFVSPNNFSLASAQLIAAEFIQNNIHHYDYYIPRFNPKMIIFKYQTAESKTKLLNLPSLNDILRKYNLTVHLPTPSNTIEKANRTIFVWNLNPNFFFHENDETLEIKLTQFIDDLKPRLSDRGLNLEQYHFIQPERTSVPKSVKITFTNKEQANKFCMEDTTTRLGVLLARSKKFDQFVSIKQCAVCRKTDHHKGDPKCKDGDRCPPLP